MSSYATDTYSDAPAMPPVNLRKVIISSVIGTMAEWYDFFIFAAASLLVFNKIFFPSLDPLVGTLVAITTYAVGFIARPIGGLVFGYFGDTRGRKFALVITLLISGGATFVIGLLPGYDRIGLWAPAILLFIRLLHGLSVGGEQANAILIACEFAPPKRRGYYGSWIQIGAPAGYVLPLALFALLTWLLPHDAFMSWGWRVPFLLSGVLVAVGLYIRLSLTESPEFIAARQQRDKTRSPLTEVLRLDRRELLLGVGAKLAEGVVFTVYAVVIVAYAGTRGIEKTDMTTGVMLGFLLEAFLLPWFGALSDRFGRRALYLTGTGISFLIAPAVFYAVYIQNIPMIWLGLVCAIALGHGSLYGAQAAFFAELFPVARRASGVSFVHQIGSLLGSALALLTSWMMQVGDGTPWLLAGYVMLNAAISFISVVFLPETAPLLRRPGKPTQEPSLSR